MPVIPKRPIGGGGRLIGGLVLALGVGLAAVFLSARVGQISNGLFRSSGRIVVGVAERPRTVAAVSAVILAVCWIAIGLRCWLEGAGARRAQSGAIRQDSPTSRSELS